THRPFDRDKVLNELAPGASTLTVKGRTIHVSGVKDLFPPPKDAPRDQRFPPEVPAVLLLDDRTYLGGDANALTRFAESAAKPDDNHPLRAALRQAGAAHVAVGFAYPARLRTEMRRDLLRSIRGGPDRGL